MKDYGTCKICEVVMIEIIEKLKSKLAITNDESFLLAQSVSEKLISLDERDEALKIIIYVLDNWKNIPENTQEIWGDLLESAGFYPYINKIGLKSTDLGYCLRKETHYSQSLNKYLHNGQKELSELIFSKNNVVASAPTSFGKSLLIEEIVASKKFSNIVIIQPTLALLDETRQKLLKYRDEYKIIVRTSQKYSSEKKNIFLLTAERILEYENLPVIDFLVLDEFYKLSNLRGDNRSNVLNNAFLKIMKNKQCQFYLLGPNIDSVSEDFLKKYNAVFYQTNYSLVSTDTINEFSNVAVRNGNKVEEGDLFKILDGMKEQTLIFCSSPATARKLAFAYCEHIKNSRDNVEFSKLPLMEWIDSNISWGWSLTKCLSLKIGVHDGAMPKHITTSTIRYFNEKRLNYLFCTNTIIEGVNTSAKNVVFYDNYIGKRQVDYFDYANIKGRAGRLMEHYVGRIINLKKPPEKEKVEVDIPIVDQNPIDSEVLVNLEEDKVKDINDNKKRYGEFKSLDSDLQCILKRNAVSIEGQINILNRLEKDVSTIEGHKLICWSQPDKYLHDHINYILDLCWENLSTKSERQSFGPKDWVRNKIVSVCYGDSIGQMIENDINYYLKELAKKNNFSYSSIGEIYKQFPNEAQIKIDNVIEKLFAFQKNWQQYRAPKWLNVVDSLQKYICKKHGKYPGDYSYVAEMVENSFIQPSLRILLEYGLPQNAVETVRRVLESSKLNIDKLTEEELFDYIKSNISVFEKGLKRYEFEILQRTVL